MSVDQASSTSAASRRMLTLDVTDLSAEAVEDIVSHVRGKSEPDGDGYPMPAGGWICFHCGQRFRTAFLASLHFGESPKVPAACQTMGARDVLRERHRQIYGERWSPEHDDQYTQGELARAAGCYAFVGAVPDNGRHEDLWSLAAGWAVAVRAFWPWKAAWLKPTSSRRDLIKAAALILAEIERIDRAAVKAATPSPGGEA